ncbi:MAG: YggT family protein [Cyanobacteria bacterium P01_F01_bin.33]
MDSVGLAIALLNPLLGMYILLFVLRIPLSWYPQVDGNKFPFALVVWPTEFILQSTRKLIPTMGGVDMSPLIWVGIASFLREILLGQQGMLTMARQFH